MKTERTCPKCKQKYTLPPAISRTDNETEICPDCGLREALADFGMNADQWEPIVKIVHEQNNKH